jgi:hypothetical protein
MVRHQFTFTAQASAIVMDDSRVVVETTTCPPNARCAAPIFSAIVSILIPKDPAADYAYWPPTYRVTGIAGPEGLQPWSGPLPLAFEVLLQSAGFAG